MSLLADVHATFFLLEMPLLHYIILDNVYRKQRKFGVTKVWRIRFSNILVDKSLANLPRS